MAFESSPQKKRNSRGREIKNDTYVEEYTWVCEKCSMVGIKEGARCPSCGKKKWGTRDPKRHKT